MEKQQRREEGGRKERGGREGDWEGGEGVRSNRGEKEGGRKERERAKGI